MKNSNLFYISLLSFLLLLTSCVSYETASSSGKKNTSSKRYTYNTSSSKTPSKSTKSTKSIVSAKEIKSGTKEVALKSNNISSTRSRSTEVRSVLNEAEKYKGTPYKYGGTTSNGIDCSGLVCVAFQKIDMKLPRRSIDMSNEGASINISNVQEGDLLFFATGGGSINHVGIVYNIANSGEITFIHTSTSKGVTISSLEETYWKGKFIKAKRVL